MGLAEFLNDLLVVIVLYRTNSNPSLAYLSLVSAFNDSSSSPEIFLYDNSPWPLHSSFGSATYIHDQDNPGISRAYNRAALHARSLNKHWMLFLDQDTSVDGTLFKKMAQAIESHPQGVAFVARMYDKNGLLSPFIFSFGRGRRIKRLHQCILPLKQYKFINSGLFVKESAFTSVGGYDERIPLDFSDISFGRRLANVCDHFVVLDVSLKHSFSATEEIPAEHALRRFSHFCTGALTLGKESRSIYPYYLAAFLHAAKLRFRHRDFRFFATLFYHVIHG